MNKESLLKLIREFDNAKHGNLAKSSEFNSLFFYPCTEGSLDAALCLIEQRLRKLSATYNLLWNIYATNDGLDSSCDEKILTALGKRVAPFHTQNGWKAPQYGVELCEYAKLAQVFVTRDEIDSEVWTLLIEGFKTLKANLESSGFRFTFERRLSALEAELAESE
jgi:hypothetical protein